MTEFEITPQQMTRLREMGLNSSFYNAVQYTDGHREGPLQVGSNQVGTYREYMNEFGHPSRFVISTNNTQLIQQIERMNFKESSMRSDQGKRERMM